MLRRSLSILALAAAAVGLLGAPAAAVPSPYAVDDVVGVSAAKGNITALRVSTRDNALVVRLQLARGVNVFSAPTWAKDTGTEIRIPVDVGGTTAPEYRVVLFRDGTGWRSPVFALPSFTEVCDALADQPGSLATIRVQIPRECLGTPSRARVRVAYEYNKDGTGPTETTDLAPDAGPTPRIDFP